MHGSQNCLPNSHRKPHRNVLRVFEVCSKILCDSKSYFGFIVGKFPKFAHTEIVTFSQFLRDHTARQVLKYTKCPAVKEFLRIPLLQIQNNFCNRFAIPIKHHILSIHCDETFCGNVVNNFDCRVYLRPFRHLANEYDFCIARNGGHFTSVINCQRHLIFKMADKNYRSQGKRVPYDILNNLSSVDLFYEGKRNKKHLQKIF